MPEFPMCTASTHWEKGWSVTMKVALQSHHHENVQYRISGKCLLTGLV